MFSRSGKNTNSQFLAFSKSKRHINGQRSKIEDDEVELGQEIDDEDPFSERQCMNKSYIASIMKQIAEQEKKDYQSKQLSKRIQNLSIGSDGTKVIDPIELLKNVEIRREAQSSFKSVTRDQRNQVLKANVTQGADIAYRVKYDQLEPTKKAVTI